MIELRMFVFLRFALLRENSVEKRHPCGGRQKRLRTVGIRRAEAVQKPPSRPGPSGYFKTDTFPYAGQVKSVEVLAGRESPLAGATPGLTECLDTVSVVRFTKKVAKSQVPL